MADLCPVCAAALPEELPVALWVVRGRELCSQPCAVTHEIATSPARYPMPSMDRG